MQGDHDRGPALLDAAWAGTSDVDHAQRCILAHYIADLQDRLDDEIAWDQRALDEFSHLTPDALTPVGIPSTAALAPSLHLNLGDGYQRRGDLDAAREQLVRGLAAVDLLADDGYGAMIRRGLDGLAQRLDG